MLKRKMANYKNKSNTNVYDRVGKLLETLELSDCSFWIRKKKFSAHRLILGISSPVFKAMLYGGLATKDDIVVSDIEPEVFQLLLNHIYTDTVHIATVEQALGLLYAAKKYMLENLTNKCIEYIEDNITVDNVFTVLNHADFVQENRLFNNAILLLREHSDAILQDNIDKLSLTSLKAILEYDIINIKEKDLIKIALNWSKFACEYQNLPVTVENRRKILSDNGLLKLLRFYTLTFEEFNEIEDNILTLEEIQCVASVLNEHTGNDIDKKSKVLKSKKVDLCPDFLPRKKLIIRLYICHRCPIISMSPLIVYPSSEVHVKIMASKTVFLNSLGVPSRMSPPYTLRNYSHKYLEQITVSIGHTTDDQLKKITNYSDSVEYDVTVFIQLEESYMLKKDKWYIITFTWPPNLQQSQKYAMQERTKVCKFKNVIFKFEENFENTGGFLEFIRYSF